MPIASIGQLATGLDLSSAVQAAARRRAVGAGARVELVEGDMRDFGLGQRSR